VIYIDSVLILNTIMDYFLLLGTASLAGIPIHRKRYLLTALLGGVYAAAGFLPGMEFLTEAAVKLAAGILFSLIAFGGEEKLLRLTVLLFAVSSGLAGCVLGMGLLVGNRIPVVNGVFYTNVDATLLLISAAAVYLLLKVMFRASARHGVQGVLLPIRICVHGQRETLTALWDSGNGLREPSDGRPVLVVAPGALHAILSKPVKMLLTKENLNRPTELLKRLCQTAPELKAHLIPYRSVGTAGGMLVAIRTEWAEIGGMRYPGLFVALSPTELGDGYTALWGGQVKKGGNHNGFSKQTVLDSDQNRNFTGREDSLHRRKRYAAAAAYPGEGDRTVGPVRRGERAKGTD